MTEPDLMTLTDLQTPWCMHVVGTLRIAQHIDAGLTGVAELAAATGCDGYALRAVLGHLVDKGVFTEPVPGTFGLTEGGRRVLGAPELLDLGGIGGRMAGVWGALLGYVRTGTPHYEEVFGLPFWADLAAHPEVAASFDALMGTAGHGTPDPDLVITGGWETVRTIVDVGGGSGTMLAELLRAHPGLHGTLVDLPATVARAEAVLGEAGVAGRATLAGQSFFDPLPGGADLYLLRKVLNDWPDADTVAILRRCAQAAGAAGRVLVRGGVEPDGWTPRLAVDMLLCGGRSSTLTEFRELARQAGLDVSAAGQQPSGYVVECRAAGR